MKYGSVNIKIIAVIAILLLLPITGIVVYNIVKEENDNRNIRILKEQDEIERKILAETLEMQEKIEQMQQQLQREKEEEERQNKIQIQREQTREYFYEDIKPMLESIKGNNSLMFIDMDNLENKLIFNNGKQKSEAVIQLYIMLEAYNQIDRNILEKEKEIKLEKSIRLESGELIGYGKTVNLSDIISSMIVNGDNNAANILIDLLAKDNINRSIQNLGLSDTELNRKMLDEKAVSQGIDNYTSVKDISGLMEKIYKQEILSNHTQDILNILSKRSNNEKIQYEFQEDILSGKVKVYAKRGENLKNKIQNDVAIISTEYGDYILCILCEGDSSKKQTALISDISRKVYDYYTSVLKSDLTEEDISNQEEENIDSQD